MLKLGASVSARLKTIHLVLHSRFADTLLRQLFGTFSEVPLPNLRVLHLDCDMEGGRKCTALCRDWDMPSLRTLKVVNVLPQLAPAVASKIISCSLELNRWGVENSEWRWRPKELLDFLGCLTAVEQLDIVSPVCDDVTEADVLQLDTVRYLVVRLPKLSVALGRNILHFAKFPNITSLVIEIGLPDIEQFEDILKNVSDALGNATPKSMSDLTISLIHDSGSTATSPFWLLPGWCAQFEKLKHITLDSPRRIAHGLLSFTNDVDSFRLSNPNGLKNQIYLLQMVPDIWKIGPSRRAIFDGEEIDRIDGSVAELMGAIRFVDKKYSGEVSLIPLSFLVAVDDTRHV